MRRRMDGQSDIKWGSARSRPAVDPILTHIRARQDAIVALIREFVECESPSDNPAAVNRFVELVADTVAPLARAKTVSGGKFGKHLVCEMQLPGARKHAAIFPLFGHPTLLSGP